MEKSIFAQQTAFFFTLFHPDLIASNETIKYLGVIGRKNKMKQKKKKKNYLFYLLVVV